MLLRRRALGRSTGRSTTRGVLAVGALAALTLAVAGCHQNVAGVSESCSAPTTLNDAFVADRTVFVRVATQPSPYDPSTTWVCYRIKPADQPQEAGRIDVNTSTSSGPVEVTTDLNSRACTSAANNLVPTPHPIEQGNVLENPVFLDAWAGNPLSAWLCLEAAGLKERVVVSAPGVDTANVDVNTDPDPPTPQDTTPPPLGKASSTCAAGAYGSPHEVLNAHVDNRDVFLYLQQPSQTEVHICARVQSPSSGGGGHLAVNAAPGQIVRVDQSTDTTPCTQDIVTLTNPPLSLKVSPPGQTPPSICLNGTRYTVVTGPVPPVVSFTPDT